jgi:hypothetical protein
MPFLSLNPLTAELALREPLGQAHASDLVSENDLVSDHNLSFQWRKEPFL